MPSATEERHMRVKAIDRHLSQTVMLDRANRVVLGLSLLAIATLCAACSPTVQKDCDQLWESRAPSADGSWIAVVHQQVCDVGLGSAVDLWVDLGRKGSVRYTVIATPTGEWRTLTPRAQLGWSAVASDIRAESHDGRYPAIAPRGYCNSGPISARQSRGSSAVAGVDERESGMGQGFKRTSPTQGPTIA